MFLAKSFAFTAAAAVTAIAQVPSAPLQIIAVSGNSGTFSLDPHDPHPVRSLFGIFETDRFVASNEIAIVTESVSNAMTNRARYFQRNSNRGTKIILVEVNAQPLTQGNAAQASYQVHLVGSVAGTIATATPVSSTHRNLLFYAEGDPTALGKFTVVYPVGMTSHFSINTWNPFSETNWQPQFPVSPEVIGTGGPMMEVGLFPNMRATYNVAAWPGLINISGTLDGTSTWAHDCFLNLNVGKAEWVYLPIH